VNILAIDTSSNSCSVAIQYQGEIKTSCQIAPMQQAQLILPMINELLNHFDIKLEHLNAIAFACGPGSFTGLRIAASVAQGLAYAASLPVVPISSMAALAQSVYLEKQCQDVLITLDARTDQIYWSIYQAKAGYMVLLGEEGVCKPEGVILSSCSPQHVIGDAWTKYHARLIKSLGYSPQFIQSLTIPTAKSVLFLSEQKLKAHNWVSAFDAMPIYLR